MYKDNFGERVEIKYIKVVVIEIFKSENLILFMLRFEFYRWNISDSELNKLI